LSIAPSWIFLAIFEEAQTKKWIEADAVHKTANLMTEQSIFA
jgi:hypothetical protein